VNYERLPPPTLAEATELVEATVAAFRQESAKSAPLPPSWGCLQSPRHGSPTKKIASGGSDVPPPMYAQQVIIGPLPARMTGVGAVEPAPRDQPERSDLPETADLLSIP
jgi:hypothetical protein